MGQIVREGTDNLTGGEVTSPPPHLIGTAEAVSSENLDPTDLRGATTRNGRSQFGVSGGSNASVAGLKPWTRDAGTDFLLARLGSSYYNVSAASWVSLGSGGTDGAYMRASALNNIIAIVVDGDSPRKWDGTTFGTLGGTPPSEAKYTAVFSSKLFLAGDDSNPQTLSFSATNNPENFTAANDAGSIVTQDGGGDTIKGLVANKKVLAILYRNFTDILIGDSVFNFRVERLIDRGLVSQWGYASAGEVCFFASDDAVYMIAGARVSDITTLKFKETYKNISDKTKVALAVRGDKLFVIDHGADKAYVCYYKYGKWATWADQPWCVGEAANDQTLYVGTDAGSTTQIWKLDTGTLDGASTITAKWRTPNLGYGWSDCPKNLRSLRVHADPGIATVTVTYYKNGVSTGSTTDMSFSSSGDHAWDQRFGQNAIRGAYLGFQFQWVGAGTLLGWWSYAEVTSDKGQIPAEPV